MSFESMNPMLSTLLAATPVEQQQELMVGREHLAANFRPGLRPGLRLDDLDREQRLALRQLLGAALTRHAFAMTSCIMSLEDVVASRSEWVKDQQREDYSVFLIEEAPQPTLRFEGHHLSLSIRIAGLGRPEVILPFCLGAYPAKISLQGVVAWQPFAPWDMLAQKLAMKEPLSRGGEMPTDVMRRPGDFDWTESGMRVADMSASSQAVFASLANSIWSDLMAIRSDQASMVFDADGAQFAWSGPLDLQDDYYFAFSNDQVAVEFINQRHGEETPNHVHMAAFHRSRMVHE